MPSLKKSLLWLVLISPASWLSAADVASTSFEYFRSDHGLQTGTGPLPSQLDAADALVWRVPLDSGHSTPILAAGKIFLTTYRQESKELAVVALDQKSGKQLWRVPLVPETVEQTHPLGNPATATVACDGEHVFAFFGSAGLFCYDLEGKKLWQQKMGPFRDEYGAGSSPMLIGNEVVINQDHDKDSFLAAFDRLTGRPLWKVPRPDAVRSYSTPALWSRDGRSELLVAGALRLTAYDPENGHALWWINGLARIVIPTPFTEGPLVYMASWAPGGDSGKRISLPSWENAVAKWDANHDGKLSKDEIDDHEVLDRFYRMDLDQDGMLNQKEWERHAEVFARAQNAILAIKPSGLGELDPSAVVWKYSRGVPYVATPVLDHGIVWMVKEGGIVTKLDAATGELLQEDRVPGFGNYFASPAAGDGKVYFASEPGTVSVVAATKEWRLISSRNFHEKIYATPCLKSNRLFLRTEKALYCFQPTGSD
ncbi:MAG TPA: PQQ-binding-like beta-propeller repeat protein [Verrucomicrobiae bacterium]|nr:PQQ-binding-like beta-propeller repeat protein [Verrucomicrobiae bacterium]